MVMSNIDLTLLPDFIVEAEEHLEEMEALLLKLVQQPDDLEVFNDIFRPIHTIKGGAQYIGLEKISRLSHRLEDLLDLLREGSIASSSEMVETLISGADRIALLVKELEATQREETSVDDLVVRLDQWISGDGATIEISGKAVSGVAAEVSHGTASSPYAAEEDSELYVIFESHLQEKYGELAARLEQLAVGGDVETLLQQVLNILEQMRSSANYMDYLDLVQRYQIWLSDIESALQHNNRGEPLQLNVLLRNMHELSELFPILKTVVVPLPAEQATTSKSTESQEAVDVTDAVARAFAAFSGEDDSDNASAALELAASSIDCALLPDFIIETEEHLEEMEGLLLQLMQEPGDREILNDIFRPIHSIKGSAQYIGLTRISRLSHVLEDLLDLLREGELESSFGIVEMLIAARDCILHLNEELKQHQQEQSEVDDLVETLQQLMHSSVQEPAVVASSPVSVSVSHLSSSPYQDDEDQELFDIFIGHLHEQHDEIASLLQSLAGGSDTIETLDLCTVVVEKMASSANYMDYVDLVQRYKIWLNEIARAREELLGGAETSIAFIQQNMDELAALFPSLRSGQTALHSTAEPIIKVVVNKPVVGGLQDTLAKKESAERAASVQSRTLFDEQLFSNLAGALDRSLPISSKDEYETLNQIFDELVSGESVVQEKIAAESSQPVQKAKVKPSSVISEAAKKDTIDSKIKKSVRVDAEKIDTLMNQVGELVVDRSYFFQLMSEMRNLQRHLKDTLGLEQREVKMLRTFTYRLGEAIASLGRTSNELQEGVMKMRMLPISQIFNRYPRLVHDLTRSSTKRVNLVVKGEDTELDRMIVEELSDPLIHIIRNAVDHGIETEAERRENGKDEEGTLILEAYQESNHIVIEVTDDGKGIDPNKVRKKAIEKGLYTVEEMERFSNDDVIALIMTAGFSTADKITGTSGRGVGMDVVKKNIEKLNGTLEIDSRVGMGTQMRLKIPLTLAIIHALMVRVSSDLFTIPLANVDETVRIFKKDTSTVEGVEVIRLRGETLPIFRLSTVFGQSRAAQSDKSFVVIVSVGGQRTGFVVDELLGQEEVVIKPLADYVQDKSGFSGATIIGDGRISLIIDVYEMVRMTALKQATRQKEQTAQLKAKIRRTGLPAPTVVMEDASR
jgi:two-component system chemotaxis sensor kinase CheA